MAFDSLTEKLQNVFKNLRGKGKLTEDDVKEALREVKMALLEADVNFKVVKKFVKDVLSKEETMLYTDAASQYSSIVSKIDNKQKELEAPEKPKAEEFICHDEVLSSLEYAKNNKNNIELIDKILAKAKLGKGLSHREAAVLLDCDIEEKNQEIFKLAEQIKKDYYGNRIVLFAPLYLSNYCVNGCVYCPYHAKNKHIPRKKMTQDEIREEVIALQDMGHKRLAIETGEDPVNNPIEYVLESLKTIYSIHHNLKKKESLHQYTQSPFLPHYNNL